MYVAGWLHEIVTAIIFGHSRVELLIAAVLDSQYNEVNEATVCPKTRQLPVIPFVMFLYTFPAISASAFWFSILSR